MKSLFYRTGSGLRGQFGPFVTRNDPHASFPDCFADSAFLHWWPSISHWLPLSPLLVLRLFHRGLGWGREGGGGEGGRKGRGAGEVCAVPGATNECKQERKKCKDSTEADYFEFFPSLPLLPPLSYSYFFPTLWTKLCSWKFRRRKSWFTHFPFLA